MTANARDPQGAAGHEPQCGGRHNPGDRRIVRYLCGACGYTEDTEYIRAAPPSERDRVKVALTRARETTNSLYSDLTDLLTRWGHPCVDSCQHAHCPLLRSLGQILEERRTEIFNARRADDAVPPSGPDKAELIAARNGIRDAMVRVSGRRLSSESNDALVALDIAIARVGVTPSPAADPITGPSCPTACAHDHSAAAPPSGLTPPRPTRAELNAVVDAIRGGATAPDPREAMDGEPPVQHPWQHKSYERALPCEACGAYHLGRCAVMGEPEPPPTLRSCAERAVMVMQQEAEIIYHQGGQGSSRALLDAAESLATALSNGAPASARSAAPEGPA